MNEEIYANLASATDEIYSLLMSKVSDGYFTMWNPRFAKMDQGVTSLVTAFEQSERGLELEKQYQEIIKYQTEVRKLPNEVFQKGNFNAIEQIYTELPAKILKMREIIAQGMLKYNQVASEVENLEEYEKEFINISAREIEDYKVKLRNRINQNISKVRQFDSLSEEERKYFLTHVIFFDEGKLENTILEALHEAEKKVEDEVHKVEYNAIIAPEIYDDEKGREYVHRYRRENEKQNPKELSVSRKIFKQGEMENKFEIWFNSLVGEGSSLGNLINEGNYANEFPIEEQMLDAMGSVIDNNLGDLTMTEMLEAYKEECVAIKECSFKEFYGKYSELEKISSLLEDIQNLFTEWKIDSVGIAEIILGER